jgi:hypothetical protein
MDTDRFGAWYVAVLVWLVVQVAALSWLSRMSP